MTALYIVVRVGYYPGAQTALVGVYADIIEAMKAQDREAFSALMDWSDGTREGVVLLTWAGDQGTPMAETS